VSVFVELFLIELISLAMLRDCHNDHSIFSVIFHLDFMFYLQTRSLDYATPTYVGPGQPPVPASRSKINKV